LSKVMGFVGKKIKIFKNLKIGLSQLGHFMWLWNFLH
jgi:hypothetical protein